MLETDFAQELDALSVRSGVFKLLAEVVTDAWREARQAEMHRQRQAGERLTELRDKKQRVLEAFLYRQSIDEATFDSESSRLEAAIAQMNAEAPTTLITEERLPEAIRVSSDLLVDLRAIGTDWIRCTDQPS